ncbi:hypothetical protein ISN45_Aa03g035060 [Arabidopsis thaliana x Arabidopsis arenosa]|uniref:Uncharacterized protein n=1 Tax=Arabidopsis thaliana x Arabidopsis arenosa TaxID=1240361 RepID=A0A8T2AYJ4_9BRAS|nr:hypothetical protein ISN45_Aa03g035060 [Arabidopsis thaliana x Arabidopsis arenosa]
MANQEEDDLVLDLLEFLNSFAVESLSEDIIYLEASETDTDDLFAADFVLVDGVVRVLADYRNSSFRRQIMFLGGGSRYCIVRDYINRDGVDDEDDYNDLDDELVPRSVSKKLKRQRIRKLGKRSSYLQLKPGCVHGKHGFGINFRC